MAFPFRSPARPSVHTLRQRILVAIGSGGLAALSPFGVFGCGSSAIDDQPSSMAGSGHAGVTGGASGTSGGTGSGGASNVGGSSGGTGGVGAGVGGAMATGGTGTTMTECPFGNGGPPVEECLTREQMEQKARFGCGQIPTTPEPTDEEVAAMFNADGCLSKEVACDGCCNPSETEGLPQGDGSCCYAYCQGSCCGRPFVVNGVARLAGVVERCDWLDPTVALALPEALRADLGARIAREWLEDARMEHASIASFARFTEELRAFAAPDDLVRDAQQAALDEVVHARACFALAARFGGVAYGPGALDTHDALPAATLREAAHRAFVEGCVGETLAAAQARAACEVAGDPETRRVLARIADDEERHALLAWRFVAWALARGDASDMHGLAADVRRALAEALAAAPTSLDDDMGEDAATRDELHHAGRLTEQGRALVMRVALNSVVRPCAEAMLTKHASVSVECGSERARSSSPEAYAWVR